MVDQPISKFEAAVAERREILQGADLLSRIEASVASYRSTHPAPFYSLTRDLGLATEAAVEILRLRAELERVRATGAKDIPVN